MSTAINPKVRAGSSGAADLRAPRARSSFFGGRVGSLVAVVPLGVWVVVHLWHNLAAFSGAEAWQAAVTEYPHPIAEAVVGILVLLPLTLHILWGLARLWSARPNNLHYGYYGNLKYLLQRLSALGVLAFVGAHLWLAFLKPRIQEGHAEAFADIAQEMHFHTPTLIVYVLGTLGVCYHLANGFQTFCMTWGLATSKRALERLDKYVLLGFVVLLAMAWGAIYALWTAGAAAA
jgi:succinate dehydrogenase / fumarate reductase cytochrome b subunit